MKIGEAFDQTCVYPTNVEVTSDNHQHFRMFQEAYPEISDFGLVSFPSTPLSYYGYGDKSKIFVAFSSIQSKETFLSWWERYTKVFHTGLLSSALIPTYRGEPATVTMISFDMKKVTTGWSWITRHSREPVMRYNDFFAFASEKDATAFKMYFT